MTQEHVLAEEEQMTAARTKQHEEEKHTGIRTEKNERRKQGKKLENRTQDRTQGIDIKNPYRLCYKAEPETLPHYLPSSYSRRQRYQVSVLPLSIPPLREQVNENQTKLVEFGDCSNSGSTY